MIFRQASCRCRVLQDFQEYFSLIDSFLKSKELQKNLYRARLYTVAGNSATVYKPFNTVGNCIIGLIYSCGGCMTFKYFKFLFATVWKGLYTVAIFQQLYERDYIQLVLSILYMYTSECIQGLWDICNLRFLMKDKFCYPSKLTFVSDFFSLSRYHSEQSSRQSVNQPIIQLVNQ